MDRSIFRKAAKAKRRRKAALAVEKQVRGTLVKKASKLAAELQQVLEDLSSIPTDGSPHWLWIVDVKRASLAMDDVITILDDSRGSRHESLESGNVSTEQLSLEIVSTGETEHSPSRNDGSEPDAPTPYAA